MQNTLTFDQMVALHQQDPAALEEYRRMALRAIVASAPEESRNQLDTLVDSLLTEEPLPNPLDNAARSFRRVQDSYVDLLGHLSQAGIVPAPTAADTFLRLEPVTTQNK